MSSGVAVADVPDSSFSSVLVSEALVMDSDYVIVEPQPLSLSRKRQAFCVGSQEDMNHDGTQVKAPPASRMIPPTPQQSP